jgi:hypothetical protein
MSIGTGDFLDKKKERWIERFARFGIISKGIVYCLIGILAAVPAVGLRGQRMNKSDAFRLIYDQPLGQFLLLVVAVGLAGYVTWRLFQAIRDIDHKGKDTKAAFTRIGYAFSAFVYATLAYYAIKLAIGGPDGSSGGGGSRRFVVSKVLEFPAGEWLIGISAVLIFFQGIRQIYKGASGKFCKSVQLIGNEYGNVYKKAGILGYISRGVVLLVLGYFFFRAAVNGSGSEIQDTKGAFDFIENTFGSLLMFLVAIGLIGYGVFMFVKGRYQKIDLDF